MPSIETPSGLLYYTAQNVENSPYPPLILVHGAGDDHRTWPSELCCLPAANIYCLDLPAHGQSDGAAQNTIFGYAESVAQFGVALALPPAIIVGHSMGGAIAQALALEFAERVIGLVLIGTGPQLKVNAKILDAAINDLDALAKLITRWQWGPLASDDMREASAEQLRSGDRHVLYSDYVACNAFDVVGQLGQIGVPTLIIGGTSDKMTPLALSQALAADIPQAILVIIDEGGHKMMLEQPTAVAQAVLVWLKECFSA